MMTREEEEEDELSEEATVRRAAAYATMEASVKEARSVLNRVDEAPVGPGGLSVELLSGRSAHFLGRLHKEFFESDLDKAVSGGGGRADRLAPTVCVRSSQLAVKAMALTRILQHRPMDLVGFKRFTRPGGPGVQCEHADKRLTRVRNADVLPLGVWAHMVVVSSWFNAAIIFAIVANAVVLGLQTMMGEESFWRTHQAFDLMDEISVVVYSIEIALKWVDDFRGFWREGWNVFDFVVTLLSAVPNVIDRASPGGGGGGGGGVTAQFRVFRTLRLLKMVARLPRLRVIMDTIFDAFSSMTFILLLLLMVLWIFAVFAVDLFFPYSTSPDGTLLYRDKFESLQFGLVTLFQVLTLDQWYFIERDVARVVSPWISVPFFVTWVWLGAFIFRNVFVGVLVKHFSEVTAGFREKAQAERERKRELKRFKKLNKHLKRRASAKAVAADAAASSAGDSGDEGDKEKTKAAAEQRAVQVQQNMEANKTLGGTTAETEAWERVMLETIGSIQAKSRTHRWPRSCLFEYLHTQARVQENLEEYEQLQQLAASALLDALGSS